MSCTDIVCGTGGWTGPKPGDPDNNIVISARGVTGGIEISWSLPLVNPYAVAHYILYRGITNDFNEAVERAVVGGNLFIDPIADKDATRYYYWIRVVSIHGTISNPIGPASAVPEGMIAKIIEGLTGKIDEGVLANSLKNKIGKISIISGDLEGESAERIAAHQALVDALAAVQSENSEGLTYVLNETSEIQKANYALTSSINVLAAGVSNNAAAILEQQRVTATNKEALASDIRLLYSSVAKTDAAILQESTTRAAANTALASQLSITQTTLSNDIASVQTESKTNIERVDGVIKNIGALWTAKVDVNGLIGGFGVYNDGKFVEAGFDVDRFWIGRTTNKKKPFIIENDVVYINKVLISDASIDTLKIAGNAITVPLSFSFSTGSIPIGTNISDSAQFINNDNTKVGQFFLTAPAGAPLNALIIVTGRSGILGPDVEGGSRRVGLFAGGILIHDNGWARFLGDTVAFAVYHHIPAGTAQIFTLHVEGRNYDPATNSTSLGVQATVLGVKR